MAKKATGKSGGGPGTLEERIKKLHDRLDASEVKQAEKLSKDLPFAVLQYAYYISDRPAAVQGPKIGQREEETLRRLFGEGKQFEDAKARLLERKIKEKAGVPI